MIYQISFWTNIAYAKVSKNNLGILKSINTRIEQYHWCRINFSKLSTIVADSQILQNF